MENTNNEFPIDLKGEGISKVNIMGVHIAAVNMEWLKKFLLEQIKNLKGEYICVSNVHTTVTAFDDPIYREIQNEACMAIPDGGPLASLGRR